MSGSSHRLGRLLSFAWAYRLAKLLIGARAASQAFVQSYIRPEAGMRILDLGCGPADILEHLGPVHYVGVDLSPEYVAFAQARHGSAGRFICADVGQLPEELQGPYDRILVIGLLHHLEDGEASQLLSRAAKLLAPGGCLVTLDGCYREDQSPLVRFFLGRDRGRRIRTLEGYGVLVVPNFAHVEYHLREDLLWIPYTHLIMKCSKSPSSTS